MPLQKKALGKARKRYTMQCNIQRDAHSSHPLSSRSFSFSLFSPFRSLLCALTAHLRSFPFNIATGGRFPLLFFFLRVFGFLFLLLSYRRCLLLPPFIPPFLPSFLPSLFKLASSMRHRCRTKRCFCSTFQSTLSPARAPKPNRRQSKTRSNKTATVQAYYPTDF